MVDDSLEFATSEYSDQNKKLNRKSSVVGNFTQLTDLSPTYSGQQIFATTTGGAFTINKEYFRNVANNAWNSKDFAIESAELSSTISNDPPSIIDNPIGNRYYLFRTLPSTEKFYLITGIEKWQGTTGTDSNVIMGVDIVNASPPTVASSPLVALTAEVSTAGLHADTTQRISVLWSKPIRAGKIIGIWASYDTATPNQGRVPGTTDYFKSTSYTGTPKYSENTAFTAGVVNDNWLKAYYRGYR